MAKREGDLDESASPFDTPEEASQYIRIAGETPDAELQIGETALALALVSLPGIHIGRYRHHMQKLAKDVQAEIDMRRKRQERDDPDFRLNILRHVLHTMHGYKGDDANYNDLQNANLIRVIERRRGLPVAIGLIYMATAQNIGWRLDGLNFPGHFLLRMDMDGERRIIDPFRDGKDMNAPALRGLLKSIVGDTAELSHQYYDAVSPRDVLIRLQNNLKKRLIDLEDYQQAILVLETMQDLAPQEYRVLFDKGVLYAKLRQKDQSIEAFHDYIARSPSERERSQARGILQQIQRDL